MESRVLGTGSKFPGMASARPEELTSPRARKLPRLAILTTGNEESFRHPRRRRIGGCTPKRPRDATRLQSNSSLSHARARISRLRRSSEDVLPPSYVSDGCVVIRTDEPRVNSRQTRLRKAREKQNRKTTLQLSDIDISKATAYPRFFLPVPTTMLL